MGYLVCFTSHGSLLQHTLTPADLVMQAPCENWESVAGKETNADFKNLQASRLWVFQLVVPVFICRTQANLDCLTACFHHLRPA